MDSLEWQQEPCSEVELLHWTPQPMNRQQEHIPPDLADADIDAFLRRMYALQQC
ncbi:MAG: hypothetical protein ACYCZR_15060 [Burkholderiales bacterium]